MAKTLTHGIPAISISMFLLLLLPVAILAQEIEQLTSFQDRSIQTNYVNQVAAFEGRIYTANRSVFETEKSRFSRIDPEEGSYEPLGEDGAYLDMSGGDRIYGSFQELDGMLFGRSQVDGSGLDLFRIDGDTAIRLTNLVYRPLSELVPFAGHYYFLVAGRFSSATPDGRLPSSYTELWRTDGTPEGTAFVEELPITNSSTVFRDRQVLVAGAESLLISGNPVEHSASFYQRYFLYRSGEEVAEVRLPENSEYASAALQHNGELNPEVVYFAGGFYLSGRIEGAGDAGPELFRIDEAKESLQILPGLLENTFGQSLGDNTTYAIVGDSLYVHTANNSTGYALYVAGAGAPEQFQLLAASDLPAAEGGMVVYRDTLYFGGAGEGTPQAVLRYVPGSTAPVVLFSSPDGQLQANLFVGEDVVYAVSQFNQRRILRYRPSLNALEAFDNLFSNVYGRQAYVADLLGTALIYIGYTETGGSGFVQTEPYILERGAEAPRVLAAMDPATPVGVFRAIVETRDGRVLFYGVDENSPGAYHLYDPADETITAIGFDRPSPETNPPYYVNTIDGRTIFTSYSYDFEAYFLFTLRGDSLFPLVDASTNDLFTLDDTYFLTRGTVDLDYQYQYIDFYSHTFTDSTVTRELIQRLYGPFNSSSSGGEYIKLSRYENNEEYTTLLRSDGTLLYNFTIPTTAELLSYDSTGYYLLNYPAGETPSLEYHYADDRPTVVFSFPEGVTPSERYRNYVLGERLVFFPYNRTVGGEPYVADPATGRVELLRDIHPGPAGSASYRFQKVGDRLFFAADDGVNGVELWRTDGTVAGTYLLKDINPGEAYSLPTPIYLGDSVLYFSATGKSGREAYGLHLETEAVGLVADINPGAEGSYPRSFLEVDSALYVVASPGTDAAPQLFRIAGGVLSPVREVTSESEGAPRLFPNPATESVTLLAEPGEELERVHIFDAAGRRIREIRAHSERLTVPVRDLLPGRYVALVEYASGARRAASLVVVR